MNELADNNTRRAKDVLDVATKSVPKSQELLVRQTGIEEEG